MRASDLPGTAIFGILAKLVHFDCTSNLIGWFLSVNNILPATPFHGTKEVYNLFFHERLILVVLTSGEHLLVI